METMIILVMMVMQMWQIPLREYIGLHSNAAKAVELCRLREYASVCNSTVKDVECCKFCHLSVTENEGYHRTE